MQRGSRVGHCDSMGDAVASRERILESWSSRPLSKKITPEDITNRRNILPLRSVGSYRVSVLVTVPACGLLSLCSYQFWEERLPLNQRSQLCD